MRCEWDIHDIVSHQIILFYFIYGQYTIHEGVIMVGKPSPAILPNAQLLYLDPFLPSIDSQIRHDGDEIKGSYESTRKYETLPSPRHPITWVLLPTVPFPPTLSPLLRQ